MKDNEFLQFFWDLAHDDDKHRLEAAEGLLLYLENIARLKDHQCLSEYLVYARQRLIRGLNSHRDAARLGFSTLLTELLTIFPPDISCEEILNQINEENQITSAVKGFTGRDSMFGRLFGYVAVIRSGLILREPNISINLLDCILKIYEKKSWIQELATEVIIMLLIAVRDNQVLNNLMAKLVAYWPRDKQHMTVGQLMLSLAMEVVSRAYPPLQQVFANTIDEVDQFKISCLQDMSQVFLLLANKFPQVHHAWDLLLSFICNFDIETNTLQRASSLTESQEQALVAIVKLLESFWHQGKEKRATAMKLTVKIMTIVPAEYFPLVLSDECMFCLLMSRSKQNNVLYEQAGVTLNEMAALVEDDNDRKIALLGVWSQHSGGNFDKQVGAQHVTTLLKSLSMEYRLKYIYLLCDHMTAISYPTVDTSTDDEREQHALEHQAYHKIVVTATNSLVQAYRVFADDSTLAHLIISILLRASCFGAGQSNLVISVDAVSQASSKKEKKKQNKKDHQDKQPTSSNTQPFDDQTMSHVRTLCQVLDDSLLARSEDLEVSATVNYMRSQLIICLSEMVFRQRREESKHSHSNGKTNLNSNSHSDILLWKLFMEFISSPCSLVIRNLSKLSVGENGDAEESEDLCSVFLGLNESLQLLNGVLESTEVGAKKAKFIQTARTFLILLAIHSLSGELSINTVQEIVGLIEKVVLNDGIVSANEDSEEEVDELESADLRLFEICVEVLSSANDQALRILRDHIKRLWSSFLVLIGDDQLSPLFVDAVVDLVTDAGGGEEAEQQEDEGEDMDEKSEDEQRVDESKEEKVSSKSNKIVQKQSRKIQESAEEEEEEEEVIIQEEDMLDFLMAEEGDADMTRQVDDEDDPSGEDEENESNGLVHSAEADAALLNMVKLRQETRKSGQLMVLKTQLLLRSRIMDTLEVVVDKLNKSSLLFCLFQPCLIGLKKASQSNMIQSIAEGRSFISRFTALVENQLCKKKIHFHFDSEDAALEEEFLEELKEVLLLLQKCITSPLQSLRKVGQAFYHAVTRVVHTCGSEQGMTMFVDHMRDLLQYYSSKRGSHEVNGKWIQDLIITRFPGFFIPRLWLSIIQIFSQCDKEHTREEVGDMIVKVVQRLQVTDPAIASVVLDESLNLFKSSATVLSGIVTRSQQQNQVQEEGKGNKETEKNGKITKKRKLQQRAFIPVNLLKMMLSFLPLLATSSMEGGAIMDSTESVNQCVTSLQSLSKSLRVDETNQNFRALVNQIENCSSTLLTLIAASSTEGSSGDQVASEGKKKKSKGSPESSGERPAKKRKNVTFES